MPSRWLAVLLAAPALVAGTWVLLVGLFFGLAMKCGDSCSSSRGWRGDPDAWQWNGLAGLGAAAFLASVVFVVLVWRGHVVWAALAYGAGAALTLWLMTGFSSDWIDHLDRRTVGELMFMILVVAAPLAALAVRRPRLDRAAP